jgi:nucleotide-binding universal stress UspA family protein
MLEKTLAETDPETTDVIVMTAKSVPRGGESLPEPTLDSYEQQLMTAVVERSEKAGKEVKPLIVATNNPLHAVLRTARALQVQEVVLGASNKFTAEEQLDLISLYWVELHDGRPTPLTVRILSQNRDVTFDLEGGNRIPKLGELKARSVAELREAGIGVDRVLLVHENTPAGSDLFEAVLTMLDPQVALDLIVVDSEPGQPAGHEFVHNDLEQAKRLRRKVTTHELKQEPGAEIVRLATEQHCDLIILPIARSLVDPTRLSRPSWVDHVLKHASCRVHLATPPSLPEGLEEQPVQVTKPAHH